MKILCVAGLYAVLGAVCLPSASADESGIAYKFTPSYYRISDGNNAADLNLRADYATHVGWIGFYRDRAGFQQARAGYEKHADLGNVRLVLSAQAASRGFLGGSLNAEIGGDTFALLGLGRTNLRDYYNLNFDPNDAITFGIGTRAIADTELSLYRVQDDRLGTGQRVTHFIARRHFTPTQRLTLDYSYKSGLDSTGQRGAGSGLVLTYDFEPWFARVGYDPDVNFSGARMMLFALGKRF